MRTLENKITGGLLLCLLVLGCESAIQPQQEKQKSDVPPSELIEQSLTHFNGQPYSELSVVQQQERLPNDLSDIYEGFGGVWMDRNDQEHIFIALVKQEFW